MKCIWIIILFFNQFNIWGQSSGILNLESIVKESFAKLDSLRQLTNENEMIIHTWEVGNHKLQIINDPNLFAIITINNRIIFYKRSVNNETLLYFKEHTYIYELNKNGKINRIEIQLGEVSTKIKIRYKGQNIKYRQISGKHDIVLDDKQLTEIVSELNLRKDLKL
jgi:hypothetical protein